MAVITTTNDPTKELLLQRLGSALRTALACTIVGCTTLYGPAPLRHILAYPSFSYMTTILIVSDATLGDALRGCWHALYASVQVIVPSILVLWMIGPARFTAGLAALAVAIGAFMVGLPKSTPLLAKRIAFGQMVIVYVGVVVHGPQTSVVMHPVHVASSTALGALASILAMLVPYPRLAYFEARKSCRLYVENASERLNLFVQALTVQNAQSAADLISQAKQLSRTGSKHLQIIKDAQSGMMWEKPQMQFSEPHCIDPGESLQLMELLMRGMEVALNSCPSFPVEMINEGLREALLRAKEKVGLKLEQAKCIAPFDATTAPETKGELVDMSQWTPQNAIDHKDLPKFFFLFCLELLKDESPINCRQECNMENTSGAEKMKYTKDQAECILRKTLSSLMRVLHGQRWAFAMKCSVSLGFAVLFGVVFSKDNGYWSGLTIAISVVTGRQATFTIANARAQGTAMGSVYGLLCCFIFQRFVDLSFLPLLPWIIFTSFLRHSKMYGQAGGISAAIGALLLLGRKNYGPPSEFAIARITEVSIGLICFLVVESLVQPARAASLSNAELAFSLKALRDCIKDVVVNDSQTRMSSSTSLILGAKQKKLKSHFDKLEKFIAEAKLEPNFWFSPFHGDCYDKFRGSFRKMNDLLLFTAYGLETLSQTVERLGIEKKELKHKDGNLDIFGAQVSSLLKCLDEMISNKCLAALEMEVQKKSEPNDIELGHSADTDTFKSSSLDEETNLEMIDTFLHHLAEVGNKVNAYEGEQKLKSQVIICTSSLAFCISSMVKETKEIEKQLREITLLENPTMQNNMHKTSAKMSAPI